MKIIAKPRRMGKTTEIIKRAAKDFGYIVCLSHAECHRIAKQAKELTLDIPFPLTFDEYIGGHFHGKGIKSFHIDNADWLLSIFSKGVPIETVTFNLREASHD